MRPQDETGRTPTFNHKILPPEAHRHAVQREGLLSRIFGDQPPRVVMFQAPAGHGKTSLMLQVEMECAARDMLTGWISLDESDNDAARFLGHLRDVVTTLGSEVNANSAVLEPWHASDVVLRTDQIIGPLLKLGRPVAMFMDDLHFVNSRAVYGFIRDLVSNGPSSIRWFFASREMPEIGLPRLVVGRQAIILRAEDLRFSRQEVERFFADASDVKVSDAEVRAIHDGTEGWPAAVQLYRLALDSPAVRDSLQRGRAHEVRELTDYLADNVLTRIDSGLQEFLLKTSILDRMTAPLCDTLLDRKDSGEVLRYLERAGMFVRRVESDQQWYTYHALFSRFLRDHAQGTYPDSLRDLHCRAAKWHREEGHFEEALHHLLCAGEHSEAADVFEMWAERLVPDGHMVTVDRWFDSIPIEELERRPGLVVKIAWAFSFLSRHRKLDPLLPLLRDAPFEASLEGDPRVAMSMVSIMKDDLQHTPDPITHIDTSSETSSRFRKFELSAVSNARGYHAMAAGRYDDALRFLARGRALSESAGATFTWAYSIGKSALTLVSQGQLQEALVQFRNALSDPRMYADDSVSTACLACGMIMTLYEMGESDLAMTQFSQFRDVITSAGIHDYLVIAYRAIARIYDQRGEPTEALAVLEEAEQLAFGGQWPRAVRLIGWERVRRELLAGHVQKACIIASRIEDAGVPADTDWIRISEDAEDTLLGRIRLHIHCGEVREAIRMIQPCMRQAVLRTRVHRQIKLHVLSALAHKKADDMAQAQRSLDKALSLAAPGRYVQALLDEGEELRLLLQDCLRARRLGNPLPLGSEVDQFHERLLGAGSADPQAVSKLLPEMPGHDDKFTEREKKVLSMMVHYMSNQQIASAMFVSVDAVKYHLKNIYGKLGVKNRLAAIRAIKA
jgi:LuxR family maltose regulon positive regulatory protein